MLSGRDTSATQSRFQLEVKIGNKWDTAICLTPLRVLKSHLHEFDTPGSRDYKYITGAAHGQEWERMVAVLCMVIGENSLSAQVVGSEQTYATRSQLKIQGMYICLRTHINQTDIS